MQSKQPVFSSALASRERSTKQRSLARVAALGTIAWLAIVTSGCAVVSVASTAVSVTAGAVGLAADAAIGTVKVAGKVAGKAVGAGAD